MIRDAEKKVSPYPLCSLNPLGPSIDLSNKISNNYEVYFIKTDKKVYQKIQNHPKKNEDYAKMQKIIQQKQGFLV